MDPHQCMMVTKLKNEKKIRFFLGTNGNKIKKNKNIKGGI